MGNFVKDGVVYTLCPCDDVHCCSQRAPAAAAAAAASDDDVVRIGDDLYLVTAVDSPLNLSSDLSGQSINQSECRFVSHYTISQLSHNSLQVCTPFLKASLKLYSTDIVLFQFMWKIVPHSWRCVVRTRDQRNGPFTHTLRCAGKTFLVFY